MPTRKQLPITPDLAQLPGALPVLLLTPDRPLRYGWMARARDHWAGRLDRTPVGQSHEPGEVAWSAWLQRLTAECHNAIARGRTRTEALIAVLDKERATLEAEARKAEVLVTQLERDIAEQQAAPARDRRPGEAFSPDEEVRDRVNLERGTALARLRSAKAEAEDRQRSVLHQIHVIVTQRHSHWAVLQERTRLLVEHHQRRASTYARGMSRPWKGITYVAPVIHTPAWAHAELGTGGHAAQPAAVN